MASILRENSLVNLVIDNGSDVCRSGFAGDEEPRSEISSVLGTPGHKNIEEINRDDNYIGNGAQEHRSVLSLRYPMERGIVTDWDGMETIWHHVFHRELNVSPQDHNVLLTEAALNPKGNREKMAQVMFETFNVPAMYVALQAHLSVYGCGRCSSIVIQCGDGVCETLPIYEGYTIVPAITRMDFGGRDLTEHLMVLLREHGYSFCTPSERETVRDIKESLCYVAEDYDKEMATFRPYDDLQYKLPDGQVIDVGDQCFRCPEALFQPSLMGLNNPGLPKFIHNALMQCEIDTRRDLWCNIMLSGGTTLFSGITERLTKELKAFMPGMRMKVIAPPERKYLPWIGGSILASLTTFQYSWYTKQHYEEYGPDGLKYGVL